MCQTLRKQTVPGGLRAADGSGGAGSGQGLGDARGVLGGCSRAPQGEFPKAKVQILLFHQSIAPGPAQHSAKSGFEEEKGNGEERERQRKSVSLQARFLPRQGLRHPARFLSSGRMGFQVARDSGVSALRGEIKNPRSPRPGWWLNNSPGCRKTRDAARVNRRGSRKVGRQLRITAGPEGNAHKKQPREIPPPPRPHSGRSLSAAQNTPIAAQTAHGAKVVPCTSRCGAPGPRS